MHEENPQNQDKVHALLQDTKVSVPLFQIHCTHSAYVHYRGSTKTTAPLELYRQESAFYVYLMIAYKSENLAALD